MSNLHTQAFQENDAVIASQLTEAYSFIHMFKFTHTEETDMVDFDVICGDFNADNMSPGWYNTKADCISLDFISLSCFFSLPFLGKKGFSLSLNSLLIYYFKAFKSLSCFFSFRLRNVGPLNFYRFSIILF